MVELITVIVIIAILASIILKDLSSSQSKARDAQRISDLGQIQLALTLFNDRCGQYPVNITAGSALTTSLTAPTCTNGITLGSFISQIPSPPYGAGQTYYPASIYYTTGRASGTGTSYVLVVALENNNVSMSKSLLYASISPSSSDTHWWPGANTSPFTYCGAQNGSYYYYCLGPN